MTPPLTYAAALLATIGIETALARLLLPGAWARLRLDVPLLNLLTHPVLTWAVWRGVLPLALGEVLVMVAEAIGYRLLTRLTWRQAVLLSVALNAVTWGAGLLLLPR